MSATDLAAWTSLLDAHDYTIAREILQRGIAAVLVIAFLSTLHQFPVLLGERGLLPVPEHIARLEAMGARGTPTLFRWRRTPYSDRLLRGMCVTGMVIGASVVVGLPQAGPPWLPLLAFLAMWGLYLSIVAVGQTFYGFGWESMLLECAAVAALLGSHDVAPPLLVLWFVRWLVIRLEFGAGMIKMRGDASWRDGTAMDHHHQTQPLPGPLSRWAHLKPAWWHRCETYGSHVVQLGAVWLLLLPQPLASLGAALIIATQLALVVTGNYAWLNWLTIIVAASAISDPMWRWALGGPWPGWGWERVGAAPTGAATSPLWWTLLVVLAVGGLVVLSWKPLKNLFSSHQLMNASFNRWHLVNAYGAFGSMTTRRREVVIEATGAEDPTEEDWLAYGFRAKPGDVRRRSPQVAPYHLRLDWMMWFLALGSWNATWFARLLERLLDGDPGVRRLLRVDPLEGRAPAWLRVRVLDYRYATREERRASGQWWVAEEIGTLVRPTRGAGGP